MTTAHLPPGLAQSPLQSPLNARQRTLIQWMIFLAITVVGIGQTVVYALLAPVGRQIGLSELQIGIIITAASFAYAITTPLWGAYSNRVGRKVVILIGLAGYALGTLGFTLALHAGLAAILVGLPLFFSLVLTRMLLCMLMSAATPAATAYMTEITTIEQRTSGMSIIATAQAVGTVLGPGFALLAGIHLLLPMYLLAGLTLVTLLMVAWVLPRATCVALNNSETLNKSVTLNKSGAPVRSRLPGRELWPYCVIGTGAFLVFSLVQVCLGYHFQDALTLSTAETAQKVGLAMMATAVGALVAQALFVRGLKWPPQVLLMAGMLSMAVGFLGVWWATGFLFAALSMGVAGMGLGMTIPAYMALASLVGGEENRGIVAGVISACPAVGFIVGPLVGSVLYTVQAALPFLFAVVLCVVMLGYVKLVLRRTHL